MPIKNYLIPFALFLSLLFNGLVIGTMVGSLFVPEGSGLAGPAIALGYGVGGTLIALLIGIILIKKLSRDWIKKIALISSILAAMFFVFLLMRYMQKQEQTDTNEAYGSITNSFDTENVYIGKISKPLMSNESNLIELSGMGIAKPIMDIDSKLYFYAKPDLSDLKESAIPLDSLTFKEHNYNIDIATAPPWFVPDYMKLDYQILQLKVISVNREWIEVEGNKLNGKTIWLDRKSVDFKYWPDFLLDVFSVEPLNAQENYLRTKPLAHASEIQNKTPLGYSVLGVKGDWLYVSTIEEDFDSPAKTGWIKWKNEKYWLIKYNLLS